MSASATVEEPTKAENPGETATTAGTIDPTPSTADIPPSVPASDAVGSAQRPPTSSSQQFEEGLINEMKNFDNLLRMLSVYRDNPDFRGNPGDRNIEEIAKALSGFIGDDVENFLSDEEGSAGEEDNNGDVEPAPAGPAADGHHVVSNNNHTDNNNSNKS